MPTISSRSRVRRLTRVGVVVAAAALPLSLAVEASAASAGGTAAKSASSASDPAEEAGEDGQGLTDEQSEDGQSAQAPTYPYACDGNIDNPHQSYTTDNTINVHFDTKCRRQAPNLYTEGSLYRSRWYGWEHLRTNSGQKSNGWKLRVVAPKSCTNGDMYRYRGEARFYVSGSEGRGSASVYRENESEIRCGL